VPLTKKGHTIMAAMKGTYGEEKGERVFYASRNKGVISGVDPESSRKTLRSHTRRLKRTKSV